MTWVLVAAAIGLWVDALAGGTLVAGPVGLLLVAVLALLAGLSARPRVLVVAAPVVVLLLAVADRVAEPRRFALANELVFYAVVVGGPLLAGALVAARNASVRELEQRRTLLEERRAVAVRAARAAESERVERAVDDALASRLTAVIAGIRRAAAGPEALAEVEAIAREALGELRGVLEGLRPVDAPASKTVPAVRTTRTVVGQVDVLLVLAVVPLVVETSLPGHRGPLWLDVVLGLTQGLALPVVRRRPLAGTVLLLAAAYAQSALAGPLPPTVGWFLPGLLLAFLVGRAPERRTAWAGLAITLAGATAISMTNAASDGFLPSLVMGILAWVAGRAVAGREARVAELRAIADELDRTRDSAALLAAADQRAELTRELHDVGAHVLTVVCLQAGAACTWWDRDRAQALGALSTLEALADGELAHLQASFGGLANAGPELPLDVLADLGRALGLTVGLRVDGPARPLGDEVRRVAFRVVQEALTNAARHARHARVEIGLAYGVDVLDVRVGDSGPGEAAEPVVPVPCSGLGLRGMRERVEAVQGELACGPSDDGGFLVHARLPLAAPA